MGEKELLFLGVNPEMDEIGLENFSGLIMNTNQKETMEYAIELRKILEDKSLSDTAFKERVDAFLQPRGIIKNVEDGILTMYGDTLIRLGEYEKGIILLKSALKRVTGNAYVGGITLFLRLAEYEFMNGNEEKGIEYLTHVCEKEADNYVEAIEFRDLTEVWTKYKHFVEGKVRESLAFHTTNRKEINECSKPIKEILNMTDQDELLLDLSEHLNELSGNGDWLNCLNSWEKKIFYIDQLWCEVNSGGFDSYLYYNGMYFERTLKAADEMGMEQLVTLLFKVKATFPKGKIPAKIERIQDVMDERDLSFDDLDSEFYGTIEREIAECLVKYITKNKEKLR